jgi:eukaryotic-like serine/threonine-protein kinase
VGKYELVRKLAIGGMAEVFLAKFEWAKGLEKTVVVKRILAQYAEDPNFTAMFLSEARLASQLSHPNIAQIIEFGDDEGLSFLAMEYVDGPSLRQLAASFRRQKVALPLPHCARIVALACEALAHAHDLADPATGLPLQLVHRDVSPDNILISKTGAVKLVDFGIAKAVTQAHRTKTGTVKGKLSYMSPEQLRAQPVDRRADIYSLGVTLYELVSGQKPFNANNELVLIESILKQDRLTLRARRPDCPPELDRIVMRAMERDKELRYADCRAMHADLEQFIISSRTPVTAFQIAELVRQAEAHARAAGVTEPLQPSPPPAPAPPPPPEPVITKTDLHPFPLERTDVSIELPFGPPDPGPEPVSEPTLEPTPDSAPQLTPVRPLPTPRPAPAPARPPPVRALALGAGGLVLVVIAAVALRDPAPPPPPVRTPAPAPIVVTRSRPRPTSPPPAQAQAQAAPPESPAKGLLENGRALLKSKDYEQALESFSDCLEVDPKLADCHLGLGSTYARLRQPEKGAEHYRKYLELEPTGTRADEVRKLLDSYEAQRSAPAPTR